MKNFSAYRIFEENSKSQGRFVELTLDDLDSGEVVIRTQYSSVNYKDALAATGAGKIVRRFPCVGGIDAVGIVESSNDAKRRARFATSAAFLWCSTAHRGMGGVAGSVITSQ